MSVVIAGGSTSCLCFLLVMSFVFMIAFFRCALEVVVDENYKLGIFLAYYAMTLIIGFCDGWRGIFGMVCLYLIAFSISKIGNVLEYICTWTVRRKCDDAQRDASGCEKAHDYSTVRPEVEK